MGPAKFWWFGISVFCGWIGGSLLFDSVRYSGPYAEEKILLGGTLGGLGLAALLFPRKHSRKRAC
jgi:hypothetical protein